MNDSQAPQKVLGVSSLALINVAAIVSLRNFPLVATYGWASILFYVIAAITFLIPSALVCAEMAAAWPEAGGLYYWIKRAFGPRWAFVAIWFSWMISIAWFPTILSFTAATFAYCIDPALADNKYFMLTVMLTVFWAATFTNFLGMRTSSLVSNIGVMLGTIIPTILIIGMATWWFSTQAVVPLVQEDPLQFGFNLEHWVFLAGVILGFEGMEVTAFHVINAKNPQRDYPRALVLSTILILLISIAGTLAISTVLSRDDINLVSGVMQVFEQFFSAFQWEHLVKLVGVMLIIGSLAGINTWVIGPAKGVFAAKDDGFLPKWMQRTNRLGVPVATLLFQAVISSIIAFIYLWMPTVQSSYWFLTVLTTQIAVLMYLFIFSAVIVLRWREPEHHRPFRIPGGRFGLMATAGLGFITCVAIFFLTFVPPHNLEMRIGYQNMLLLGLAILACPPFYVFFRKKQSM